MVDGKPELTGGDATVIERQGFAGQYLPASRFEAGHQLIHQHPVLKDAAPERHRIAGEAFGQGDDQSADSADKTGGQAGGGGAFAPLVDEDIEQLGPLDVQWPLC
ncbi:hypothetical protein D3C84_411170 [compost metagenome]